jgi:hypothetical protein
MKYKHAILVLLFLLVLVVCIHLAPRSARAQGQNFGNLTFGAGVPTSNCSIGSQYNNTAASSTSTVIYVCYPANTWTAVTVP